MRNWLIRLLGGMPRGDVEAFRVQCRDFAEAYLQSRGTTLRTFAGPHAPNGQALVRAADSPVVVIGDYVAVWAEPGVEVQIAPWSKRTSVAPLR